MLLKKLKIIVEEECKKDSNLFGYAIWEHIKKVVKFGKLLSEKLNVDKEIVEISAWLHDYGSIIGNYKNHHIIGAKEAEKILKQFNYPQERIEKVKHCIYSHRGSKNIPRKTLEAEIIASADAMSQFVDISSLFYLAYSTHKLNHQEGAKFIRKKIEQSWNKIMPEGKEIVRKKYNSIMELLENAT